MSKPVQTIRCLYDKLVPIDDLKNRFHPKNRNKHSDEQIDRLAKILIYQGVRYCAKVSNLSGLITSGHGRILAAEKAGWEYYPVNFQDYENEDQEYSDLQADNAIASWAELDLAGVNSDLAEIGPIDIDLLGIENFSVVPEFESKVEEDTPNQKKPNVTQCPNCGECFDANENKPEVLE